MTDISYKLNVTRNVETALPLLLYTHQIQNMSDDTKGGGEDVGQWVLSHMGKITLKTNVAFSDKV